MTSNSLSRKPGSVCVLTEVLVLPQVADGHVASQQHGDTTEASPLHVDVLVVVSVMAWRRRKVTWSKILLDWPLTFYIGGQMETRLSDKSRMLNISGIFSIKKQPVIHNSTTMNTLCSSPLRMDAMMPLGVKSRPPSQVPSSPSFTSIRRFSTTATGHKRWESLIKCGSQWRNTLKLWTKHRVIHSEFQVQACWNNCSIHRSRTFRPLIIWTTIYIAVKI